MDETMVDSDGSLNPYALKASEGWVYRFGIDFTVKASEIREGSGAAVIEYCTKKGEEPPEHTHPTEDEMFYVLEGEYLIEVGQERLNLKPGDSLLAPRKVPHVWAYVGDKVGRLLITFTPAGTMEAFFRQVSKAGAMPPQDPVLWRAHGMELLGPPLPV